MGDAPSGRTRRRRRLSRGRLLQAHGLLDPLPDVATAVVRAGLVYAAAPTCHHALAARVRDYTPSRTLDALEARELVRVAGPRGSIFVVPAELVPAALALTGGDWLLKGIGVDQEGYEALADEVLTLMGERTDCRPGEIRKAMANPLDSGRMTLLLRKLGDDGLIVRSGVRGSLRSHSWTYAAMHVFLPNLERVDRDEALATLAPIWLAANGPATADQLAWWAGCRKRVARAALDAIDTVDVAGMVDVPDAVCAKATGTVMLPTWDPLMMAHTDRSRFVDEAHRPYVVDKSGNVTATILRAGRVVGVWDLRNGVLRYAPLPGEDVDVAELEPGIERLRGVEPVDEILRGTARPLAAIGRQAFQRPLR